MTSFQRIASLVAMSGCALTVPANAGDALRLASVAAANGYSYQWMDREAGAMLERPGVRIVIHAGRVFYEVNAATPVADSAPRFDGRDLLISAKLAAHLRELARKYPYPPAGVEPAPAGPVFGALTLRARQIPGRDALALSGRAPAGVPVTITLSGEISADLPVVTLFTCTVVATQAGSFSTEVYYGQDSHVGTYLAARATSLDGVTPASTRVAIGIPSGKIRGSALDAWPPK